MRVLIVKLSSMGDVIHSLPALTDAQKAIPGIKFDWLVEDGFKEIPAWHPAVERVIPISLRKRNFKQIISTIKTLNTQKFDLIIDAQGLIKSAVLARLLRANKRVGYDAKSSRESIASWFYHDSYQIAKEQHAVDRIRQLFAKALNYPLPDSGPDFAIQLQETALPVTPNRPYLIFLHGTTWESKHWPEQYWLELAHLAGSKGFDVHVTWANPEQLQRAQRLTNNASNVVLLPHLTINQAAMVLRQAHGALAVDTGFAHLSAALNKPTIAMYGPTAIAKCGTVGSRSVNLGAEFACAPCGRRICNFVGDKTINPPCFAQITPQRAWQKFLQLIS